MANANFVNSQAALLKLKLEDWFLGDSGTRFTNYRNKQYETIRSVGLGNRSTMNPIFKNGSCTAVEVVFLKNCAALGAHTCATPITTCDLPTGAETTSDKVTVNALCEFREGFQVNDDLCDNIYQAQEIIQRDITRSIQNLRIKADRKMIADLMANAQPNIDPLTIGTVAGTTTEIPSATWTMDLLPQMNSILMFNGIEDYVIADNRNFAFAQSLAPYHRLNDNQRSDGGILDDYDNIFEDGINIQAVTARASTFAIDRDMVGVLHWNKYQNETPLMIKDNHWVWSISDPEWTIRSPFYNPATTNTSDASMRVKYDIELQKICTGRDTVGRPIFLWKYMITLQIKPVFSPAQCDGVTGVMEFVKVP